MRRIILFHSAVRGYAPLSAGFIPFRTASALFAVVPHCGHIKPFGFPTMASADFPMVRLFRYAVHCVPACALRVSAPRLMRPCGSPGVRHWSFTAQPPDLPSWLYVYPLGFGLSSNLARHLALYQVSVRRLVGFAYRLPSLSHYCFQLAFRYTWR